MALNLEQKKAIVAEVAEVAVNAVSAVAAEYRGLSVTQTNQLRFKARDMKVHIRVVRNTLAKRALANTAFECMQDALTGPLVLAFSKEDPSAAARLFKDFAKANEKFNIIALSIGGKLLHAKDLDAVASLPTKNEAIAQLMAVLKAPISQFVRTLAEPHAKLVRVVAAVRDQKQAEN